MHVYPPISRGSSPHTRGAHSLMWIAYSPRGIIPAYAGSTAPSARRSSSKEDHPRIRGEHKSAPTGHTPRDGSSPHTRGAHRRRRTPNQNHRIIPAYAGSTTRCLQRNSGRADHPRIRGEHFRARFRGSGGNGIIPAYAGSTLGNPCNTKDRRRDYTSFPLPVTHPSGGGGS